MLGATYGWSAAAVVVVVVSAAENSHAVCVSEKTRAAGTGETLGLLPYPATAEFFLEHRRWR
jgi:hypothetical protein